MPGHSESVEISFVGPRGDEGRGKPAIVMVHGFDSSCLEFRRLFPLLEENFAVYAVDVLGWGFTNSKGQDCGPKFKGGVVSHLSSEEEEERKEEEKKLSLCLFSLL